MVGNGGMGEKCFRNVSWIIQMKMVFLGYNVIKFERIISLITYNCALMTYNWFVGWLFKIKFWIIFRMVTKQTLYLHQFKLFLIDFS
jgi:hypothetical protein